MTNVVIVRTQDECNALPKSYEQFTRIEIHGGTPSNRITINNTPANSHVVARGSSHVVARGSSHVEAWGSSHVVAWGSSHVVARESSHVVARGSSHVEAWGSCAVHVHSGAAEVLLFGFAVAVAVVRGKNKVTKKSKSATLVVVKDSTDAQGWLDDEGVDIEGKGKSKHVTLFKRVSHDWKTQEGTANETLWVPGTSGEHPSWSPKDREVGAGKFHACPRPHFCDEFRKEKQDDRYVAIRIKVTDLYVWPGPKEWPHKVAFRAFTVLHECDRDGKKIATAITLKEAA